MGKLSINKMKFNLSERVIKLEVIPIVCIFKKSNRYLYKLPDTAYGEVLILQNQLPKFYYSAFKEDGELGAIANFSKENQLDLEETVLRVLKNSNYDELTYKQNTSFKILKNKSSKIKEFTVSEIID